MAHSSASFFANSNRLVDAMGRWPSFHDAKVKSVVRSDNFCRALLHVFEMTDQVDSEGYFVLTKHHLVTLQMSDVKECTLPDNYDSDVLFGLTAESEGALVKVVFDSVIDLSLCWHCLCKTAEVIDVVPCPPNG
jgi:hypothetical protein